MKLSGNWQAAWDWFVARKQQAALDAAAEQIKSGNLRGAIKILEETLPRLRDRTTRALVLQRLVKVRLQLAHRLTRAEKSRAAQREFRATMRLVSREVTSGALSPGKAISLIGFTLERLTHYKQTAWISELRVTAPPAAKQAVSAAKHLEAMTLASSLSPVSAHQLVGDIAAEAMPMAWWMTMHDLLYRQGLVRAAVAAKQAAASSFLAKSNASPNGAMQLAAAVCLDDRDRIETVIEAVNDPVLKRDGLLALGEVDRARDLHASMQSASDRRFSRWIGRRSVAVVGPARNRLGSGEAIDAHDRVVRTNFIANDAFRAAGSMIGTRTDAAYYNSIFLERQPEAIARTLREENVDFAMLRTQIERMRIAWQTRGHRTRSYYFSPSIFMGRGFAMRHILHDLALMPVGQITCYGSDFFLGADSHFSGYAAWRHAFEHAESYIVHDPLDCWRFMKRLLNAGLMKADAVLDEILNLEELEFILALERRFEGRMFVSSSGP
ncbi:hypothetical protein [Neorhizobium alkalisoli]|uniref:Uncharacterized protein n=1 Tax=Neorhizobium alkalisoli TaxID=528178 RepID=A0A561QH02_9HYPH|nr:hypothetical protein [Neorhizobium alkalisoli]TWF49642.1 hypothetical protein FHW37_1078 [Neorhizobium alkalisoli]